jgi:protein MpaA
MLFDEGWSSEEFGRSHLGAPMMVFAPAGIAQVDGLLIAAVHGEEPETLLLARRLVERVAAEDTTWAIVPCANPDGVTAGTRQNAAGVDLNRNWPSASWKPDDSYSYPPGTTIRKRPNRTNRSSPGPEPTSEPETRALLTLIDRLEPDLIVDLHSPLALVAPTPQADPATVQMLAMSAELPVQPEIGSPTPGALRDWCTDQGIAAITYEVEHAPLPALCERHLPGLSRLLLSG